MFVKLTDRTDKPPKSAILARRYAGHAPAPLFLKRRDGKRRQRLASRCFLAGVDTLQGLDGALEHAVVGATRGEALHLKARP